VLCGRPGLPVSVCRMAMQWHAIVVQSACTTSSSTGTASSRRGAITPPCLAWRLRACSLPPCCRRARTVLDYAAEGSKVRRVLDERIAKMESRAARLQVGCRLFSALLLCTVQVVWYIETVLIAVGWGTCLACLKRAVHGNHF